MNDDNTDLKLAVVRLETALTLGMKSVEKSMADLSHDIKNLRQSLESFMPRSEISAKFHSVEERVKTIEKDLTFWRRAIITAWISGLATVGAGVFAISKLSGHS